MKKILKKILIKVFNISSVDISNNINSISNSILGGSFEYLTAAPFTNYSFLKDVIVSARQEGIIFSHFTYDPQNYNYSIYFSFPNGINLLVVDNLWVFNEIFLQQNYKAVDFYNKFDDFIVIDVGMNQAFATLYFAQLDNCKKVYGYEMMPDTYEIALKNIKLNPQLSHKIEAYNYGMSNQEKTEEIKVHPKWVSYLGVPDFLSKDDFVVREIHLKKQYNIYAEIVKNHPNEKKVLKFDTEGAEYEMLDALLENDLILQFDMLIGEAHEGYQRFFDRVPDVFECVHLMVRTETVAEFCFIKKDSYYQ